REVDARHRIKGDFERVAVNAAFIGRRRGRPVKYQAAKTLVIADAEADIDGFRRGLLRRPRGLRHQKDGRQQDQKSNPPRPMPIYKSRYAAHITPHPPTALMTMSTRRASAYFFSVSSTSASSSKRESAMPNTRIGRV